jgi:hypothetical protein
MPVRMAVIKNEWEFEIFSCPHFLRLCHGEYMHHVYLGGCCAGQIKYYLKALYKRKLNITVFIVDPCYSLGMGTCSPRTL